MLGKQPAAMAGVFFTTILMWSAGAVAEEPPPVSFVSEPGRVQILAGENAFATYVYEDDQIPRPYFCAVRAPGGIPVTRNHPPIEGTDPTDHATYHPGIWLAFGDISGADFWRSQAQVKHERFVEEPAGEPGSGSFAVQNVYMSGDKEICRETCRYRIIVRPLGYFLMHDSEFSSETADFVLGDQEEMGLGVRMATPLTVKQGGVILNSNGQRNERGVWGKQAHWCDYSGVVQGRRVGVTLIPHPDNFRDCWFHARDYGLLVANPFGRNAFTNGKKSAITVRPGERLPLRFGLFVYSADPSAMLVPDAAYRECLELFCRDTPMQRQR